MGQKISVEPSCGDKFTKDTSDVLCAKIFVNYGAIGPEMEVYLCDEEENLIEKKSVAPGRKSVVIEFPHENLAVGKKYHFTLYHCYFTEISRSSSFQVVEKLEIESVILKLRNQGHTNAEEVIALKQEVVELRKRLQTLEEALDSPTKKQKRDK
jgi:hypothetical protein